MLTFAVNPNCGLRVFSPGEPLYVSAHHGGWALSNQENLVLKGALVDGSGAGIMIETKSPGPLREHRYWGNPDDPHGLTPSAPTDRRLLGRTFDRTRPPALLVQIDNRVALAVGLLHTQHGRERRLSILDDHRPRHEEPHAGGTIE